MHPDTTALLGYSMILHNTDGGVSLDAMACGILYSELRPGSFADQRLGYYLVATARHVTQNLVWAQGQPSLAVHDSLGTLVGVGCRVFPSTQFDLAFVVYCGYGFPTHTNISQSIYDPWTDPGFTPDPPAMGLLFPGPPRHYVMHQSDRDQIKPFIQFPVSSQILEYRKLYPTGYKAAYQGPIKKPAAIMKKGWQPVWRMNLPSRPGSSGGIVLEYETGRWLGMVVAGDQKSAKVEGHGDAVVLAPAQIHEGRREIDLPLRKFLKSLPR